MPKHSGIARRRKLAQIQSRIGTFIAHDTFDGSTEERARLLLMDALNRIDQAQHLLEVSEPQPAGAEQLTFNELVPQES